MFANSLPTCKSTDLRNEEALENISVFKGF